MNGFEQVANGIASLLRAIAWPGVVVFLAFRYRDHIGRLIDRLRKGGPAEFDPLPPTQIKPAGALSADPSAGANAIAPLRTTAVVQWEAQIRALPLLSAEPDATKREQLLITLAAKAFLNSAFERTEAVVYASQLDLLSYLNARPDGESVTRLREFFYEPATARFPLIYRNYPFESYISFLQQALLLVIVDLKATITSQGSEYLLWRVEQHKSPRLVG